MPKPPGTFLQVKGQDKMKAQAASARSTVAIAKAREQDVFFAALDQLPQSKLDAWRKSMADLRDAIRKSEPLSKEDKVRKAVSGVIGELRKVLGKVKDYKAVEGTLERPAQAVMRAPPNLGSAGAELALVIALCQVLEVLVRLRKAKRA